MAFSGGLRVDLRNDYSVSSLPPSGDKYLYKFSGGRGFRFGGVGRYEIGFEDGGDARDREGAEAEHGGLDQSTAVDARGHGVSVERRAARVGGPAGWRTPRPVRCEGYRSAAR